MNKYTKLIYAAMVLALSGCAGKEAANTEAHRQAYEIPAGMLPSLVIDTVHTADIIATMKFNGIVDYNTDKVENIFPLVSGTIDDIRVKPGDHVVPGQVLGIIRSVEVANYNAALITAQTNESLAATMLARQKDMAKSGLASQLDVTSAEVAYKQATAARVAAEKVMKINGNNLGGVYEIKAPVEGYVVQKNVTNGMALRPDNGTNMFTIADLNEVWVQANVYEANINTVHEGDSATISTLTDPDKKYTGRVDRLMNVLDPANRVMKMRVILPNKDHALKPQMFATITIKNDLKTPALSVPSQALIFDHSQYYVVVYKGPKDVKIRTVTLISNNGERAYIKDGLEEGERVIGSQALLIYSALNS